MRGGGPSEIRGQPAPSFPLPLPRKKKKMPKSAVGLDIKPEDEAYARKQDQWGCAIVRCIQRTLPDAIRVKVNRKNIAFTLERDDIRYTFLTPEEVREGIIRPFDLNQPITLHNFVLTDPISAEPVQHQTIEQRQQSRMRQREVSTRTSSANVRTYERFLESEE